MALWCESRSEEVIHHTAPLKLRPWCGCKIVLGYQVKDIIDGSLVIRLMSSFGWGRNHTEWKWIRWHKIKSEEEEEGKDMIKAGWKFLLLSNRIAKFLIFFCFKVESTNNTKVCLTISWGRWPWWQKEKWSFFYQTCPRDVKVGVNPVICFMIQASRQIRSSNKDNLWEGLETQLRFMIHYLLFTQPTLLTRLGSLFSDSEKSIWWRNGGRRW